MYCEAYINQSVGFGEIQHSSSLLTTAIAINLANLSVSIREDIFSALPRSFML